MKNDPNWITNHGFGLRDEVEFWATSSSPFKYAPEQRRGRIIDINSKTVTIRTKYSTFKIDNHYRPGSLKMIWRYKYPRPEPEYLSKVK